MRWAHRAALVLQEESAAAARPGHCYVHPWAINTRAGRSTAQQHMGGGSIYTHIRPRTAAFLQNLFQTA